VRRSDGGVKLGSVSVKPPVAVPAQRPRRPRRALVTPRLNAARAVRPDSNGVITILYKTLARVKLRKHVVFPMSCFYVLLAFAATFVGMMSSIFASEIAAPIGFHDHTTPIGLISGWALDPYAPTQPLDVKIYIGGPIGSGRLLGTVKADALRSDVNKSL